MNGCTDENLAIFDRESTGGQADRQCRCGGLGARSIGRLLRLRQRTGVDAVCFECIVSHLVVARSGSRGAEGDRRIRGIDRASNKALENPVEKGESLTQEADFRKWSFDPVESETIVFLHVLASYDAEFRGSEPQSHVKVDEVSLNGSPYPLVKLIDCHVPQGLFVPYNRETGKRLKLAGAQDLEEPYRSDIEVINVKGRWGVRSASRNTRHMSALRLGIVACLMFSVLLESGATAVAKGPPGDKGGATCYENWRFCIVDAQSKEVVPHRVASRDGANSKGVGVPTRSRSTYQDLCNTSRLDPQPPASDPAWLGNSSGAIYVRTCPLTKDLIPVANTFWRPVMKRP